MHRRSILPIILCLAMTGTAPGAETGCPGGICRPETPPAQGLLESPPHGCVVRVVVADASGGRSYGSGTLIGGEGDVAVVLTCAHLFEHGTRTATVQLADGRSVTATLLEIDSAWDLAALKIAPVAAEGVTVADAYPKPGSAVTSCGYGPNGRFMCNRGHVLGYTQTGGATTHETLQWTGSARQGDSGGPALDEHGRLVAVLWGTDGRTVAGTYCGRIRKFLARILPHKRPPARPLVPLGPPPSQTTPKDDSILSDLQRRLDKIEAAVAVVASLRRKIDDVAALANGTPSADASHPTGQSSGGLGSVLLALLPQLMAALGWTGPPSIAAVLAARLLVGLIRRKRQAHGMTNKTDSGSSDSAATNSILNDDYARQLAGVFALSGRSPLADATLGREYDEELRRAEESTDGVLAAWAKKLRSRVATRFYRIHGQTPSPAEPARDEG